MSDADQTADAAAAQPPPPGFLDLLTGPLSGFSIHRRAADVSRWLALGVLLAGLVAAVALAAGVQVLRFSRTIDAMEDSAISFMPRVNIQDGTASVEAAPGRVIETDRIVVLFDTRPEPGPVPPAEGDDDRDRVLVGDRALVWYAPDRPVPLAMPWGVVNQQLGPRVSVDGPELIAALRRTMPGTVLFLAGVIGTLFLLWELLLIGVLVGMYRILFGRRLGSPGPGRLFVVGCLASLPATLAGLVVVLLLGRQELALLVHGAVLGSVVLVGGNSLVGLPVPRKAAAEDAPPPKAVATEL